VAAKQKWPMTIASFLAEPRQGTSVTQYRKNDIIFSQGDVSDAAFYIQKGKLKATVVSKRGKEAITAMFGPDDFFGEACIVAPTRRLMTVSAMTESSVVRIGKPAMIRLLHDHPDFSRMFMIYALSRTVRVEADLVDQLFNSSERRLARLLVLLSNYGKKDRKSTVISNVTQETLADMIGTTRSRVSVFMNRFRKLGFISYNGHIEVHESLLNFVLRDFPQIRR